MTVVKFKVHLLSRYLQREYRKPPNPKTGQTVSGAQIRRCATNECFALFHAVVLHLRTIKCLLSLLSRRTAPVQSFDISPLVFRVILIQQLRI